MNFLLPTLYLVFFIFSSSSMSQFLPLQSSQRYISQLHTLPKIWRKKSHIKVRITANLILYTMRKRKDKFELVFQRHYGIMTMRKRKDKFDLVFQRHYGIMSYVSEFRPITDQIQTHFRRMVRIWTISENSDQSRCSA